MIISSLNASRSKRILNSFYDNHKKRQNKEQVKLELILEGNSYNEFLIVRLKVGLEKKYDLNRILEFLDIYGYGN